MWFRETVGGEMKMEERERDGFGLKSDWSVLEVCVELSLEPRSRVSTMTG